MSCVLYVDCILQKVGHQRLFLDFAHPNSTEIHIGTPRRVRSFSNHVLSTSNMYLVITTLLLLLPAAFAAKSLCVVLSGGNDEGEPCGQEGWYFCSNNLKHTVSFTPFCPSKLL
jgi:hypothetical protein